MRRASLRGLWPLLVILGGSPAAWGDAAAPQPADGEGGSAGYSVCPPFFLRDESGRVINPVLGQNAAAPYSPKQTCGACHDYDTVTEGFHFQQGRGEELPAEMAERYQWATSPGNYGGVW